MLQLHIPAREYYDSSKQEFIMTKAHTLNLEHSLVAISKWESKWHKPFLGAESRTIEESKDYIKCMTLNGPIDDSVYDQLTQIEYTKIAEYMEDKMTATRISEKHKRGRVKAQTITAELIYYWMIDNGIPFECQKWHINRLLTLIRVCEVKNTPQKKMSKAESLSQYKALNEARRRQLGTRG